MGSVLNLIYDNWNIDENQPLPNGWNSHFEHRHFRGMTGLLHYYNFHDYKWFTIDKVSEFPNEKFYYFVNHITDLFEILKTYNDVPILPEVKSAFKENPNLFIVFINEHEYERKDVIPFLEKMLEKNSMDSSRVYLINNNALTSEHIKDLGSKMLPHSIEYLPTKSSKECVQYETKFVPEKSGHLFLMYNRTPKAHRYALLALLKKMNMLDNVDWSLVMGWYHKRNLRVDGSMINWFFEDILTPEDRVRLSTEIDFLNQIEIKKTSFETERDWFNSQESHGSIDWSKIYEVPSYESTYINIITESAYKTNEIHITEKSFRPFYFNQFPIFVASPHHVKMLRTRYDFDMFDDVINHTYDEVENHRDRMFAIFQEILRLYRNREKIKEFYKNNEERFLENQNKIKQIAKSDKDFKFFKTLKR